MTIGRETGRCTEKRQKVRREAPEGALRYTLIGANELAKLAREAREGGSNKAKKVGARKHFQRHFSGSFLGKFFSRYVLGVL